MIITDDQQPDSSQKSLKTATSSTVRPAEAPPSYDDAIVSNSPASPPLASPMFTSSYYNYQAISPFTAPPPQGSDVGSTKGALRRFMSALALALIIYTILVSFLGIYHESQVKVPNVEHGKNDEMLPPIPISPPEYLPGPTTGDGEIIECTRRESWSPVPSLMANRVPWKIREEQVAYTTFSMPLDVPNHYFLSRGAHAAGTFILENDDDSSGDQFYIHVQASWRHEIAMQSSQLCLLRRQDGSIGLGIYTQERESPFDRRLDINLVLRVQLPTKNAPLQLNSLAAGLSQFEMDIETREKVEYGSLVLATSNAAIRSMGSMAKKLVFATSNGPILGTYNVTKSMVITTSNGHIDISLNAFNNDPSHATSIAATTRNGRIDVNANLYYTGKAVPGPHPSTHDMSKNSNGTFTLDFTTSNGGIAVDFMGAPIGSALSLSTTTSNAEVDLYLHPTYEGRVNVIFGTNGDFKLDAKEPRSEDPTGRGRGRLVDVRRVWAGIVTGTIAWDANSQRRGELMVTSSNGVCTLHI